ncbi:MAG TPA: hypothetical protein VMH90_05985, partial [Thermoplasmata archaeon]|nr:hypothetical protein [Thermoplasmata archaeon]
MRSETVERLRCPLCHGRFQWSAVERSGTEIRSAQVLCPSCGTRSEVREGIGYFLPGDAELARDSPRGRMGEGRPRPATDPRWARSIHRCAEFARGALGPDAAPLLALDAQGILAPFAPGGGYHVVQDPAELAPRGDPGSDGWDELV